MLVDNTKALLSVSGLLVSNLKVNRYTMKMVNIWEKKNFQKILVSNLSSSRRLRWNFCNFWLYNFCQTAVYQGEKKKSSVKLYSSLPMFAQVDVNHRIKLSIPFPKSNKIMVIYFRKKNYGNTFSNAFAFQGISRRLTFTISKSSRKCQNSFHNVYIHQNISGHSSMLLHPILFEKEKGKSQSLEVTITYYKKSEIKI